MRVGRNLIRIRLQNYKKLLIRERSELYKLSECSTSAFYWFTFSFFLANFADPPLFRTFIYGGVLPSFPTV